MTGIILAAGRGGRLRDAVGAIPKCLIRIGDSTLLERQIRSLRDSGVDRLVVVAGYRADRVRRALASDVSVVYNPRFSSTNSLYSLWMARDYLRDECVILNADVLFHPQLLIDLLSARYDDALLVSSCCGLLSDEEMKVRIRRGCVVAIAKTIAPDDADGENIGIAKFGVDGIRALLENANRLIESGSGRTAWLPAAFDLFCRHRPLHVVDSRGYPWIEIDFPEDYWCACRDVLPAIDVDEQSGRVLRQVAASGSRRTRYHV
jgi:L-glutamine-phosphate cytidylyltransferase